MTLSSSLHWLNLPCSVRLVPLEYCRYAPVCDAVRSSWTRRTSSPSSPAVQKSYLEMSEQRKTQRSNQSKINDGYGSVTGTETHLSPFPCQRSDTRHLQSLVSTCIYTPRLSGSQCHRSGTAGTYTRCTRPHSHRRPF